MIKLKQKIKVYSDGKHNAFTDLIYHQKMYYLAFRNGTTHTSMDGRIFILKSKDGKKWEKISEISIKNMDCRDPKLFCFKKRLFCLFPLRVKRETFDRLPMISQSIDGKVWSEPEPAADYNLTPWRSKIKNRKIYTPFYYFNYCNRDIWKSSLYKSYEGKNWEEISCIYEGEMANETEIEFVNNEIWAVIRREGKGAIFAKAKSPYKKWQYYQVPNWFHSPAVKKMDRKLILAVREFKILYSREKRTIADEIIEKDRYYQEVSLWEWKKKKNPVKSRGDKFKKSLVLEKGINIDSGYCGIEIDRGDKDCLLISYYLGSAQGADIWLAKVKVK